MCKGQNTSTDTARGGPTGTLSAVRVVHPFPTVLNAVASVALACVAERGLVGTSVALRLAGTMLTAQSAIGAVNDIVDRDLDRAAKPGKPIASGAISLRAARVIAVVAIGISLVLGATFGPAALALSAAGMGMGLLYDLRLKRTAFSWLAYAIALPLLPLWVWTAVGRFTPALPWVWPIGLVLGGALQLVNALPDYHGDSAGGIHGAAQRLGLATALLTAWGGYGLAIGLALGLGLALGASIGPLLAGVGTALVLLCATVAAYLRRPGAASLQLGWTLLAPGAGLLALGWLAALPR